MSLIPWRPFRDLDKWFEEEGLEWPEKWFSRVPAFRVPKMDIYEDNGNVIAEVELPGTDPKNIKVEVKDNILKIEAKTEEKKEEKRKGYYKKELSKGYYKRAVPLPVEVIGEKADASYKEGVLKVIIPQVKAKKKDKKTKKIKVKTS
jgi:HSP20 family protein